MNLHFGSESFGRIRVSEVIFPSAVLWVLVQDAGLIGELLWM